jgi:cytochrome P450
MIAGRDTTANVSAVTLLFLTETQALSWSIYRLCLHPKIQQTLAEEVLTLFKKYQLHVPSAISSSSIKQSPFRIPYECLQEMKYLEAFTMEVRTLSPVLSLSGVSCLWALGAPTSSISPS